MEFDNLTADMRSLIERRLPEAELPVNGQREACEAWYHRPATPLLEAQITSGAAILGAKDFTFVSETDVVTFPIFPEARAFFHPDGRILVICQRRFDHTFQFVVDDTLGIAADRAFSSSSSDLQVKLDSHWLAPREVHCARQLVEELEVGEFLLGLEAGDAAPFASASGSTKAVIGYTNTRLLIMNVVTNEFMAMTWEDVRSLGTRKKFGSARLLAVLSENGKTLAVRVRSRFADRIDLEWSMRSSPLAEWKSPTS